MSAVFYRVAPRGDGEMGLQVLSDGGIVKEVEGALDLIVNMEPGYYDENGVFARSLDAEPVIFERLHPARDAEWKEEDHPRDDEGKFASISTYIGENPYKNSVGINAALRERQNLTPEQQKIVDDVDAAIKAASPLKSAQTWYRGTDVDVYPARSGKDPYTVRDPAFTSVSADRDVAEEFATQSDRGYVYEIEVPRGVRALATTPYQIEGMQYQNERLLPRNAMFERIGRPKKQGSITVVRLRYVTHETGDWNPFQPRAPKGDPEGGQWVGGGGGESGSLSFNAGSRRGLEPTHVDALKQYAASVYYPVNRGLRRGEPLSSVEQAVVKALDEAFDRMPKTAEVMQLFRAAGEEFADILDSLSPGDDVVDPAFVSTTIDENYARTLMSGQPGEKKALIEIVTPKESRAIDTTPYNPFKGENETLLPRNTTFRFLGREGDRYRFRANPRPAAA